jgi:hypothetical protein
MTMHKVPTDVVAHLLGERQPATLRKSLSRIPAAAHLGERRGRDLLFNMGEYGLLALAYELRSDPRTLKTAFAAAVTLAPELLRLEGADPPPELYAVVLSGRREDEPEQRRMCEGRNQLLQLVTDATLNHWPRIDLVDLKALHERIHVFWALAVGRDADLVARFVDHADQMPAAERDRMAALIAEGRRRLGGGAKVMTVVPVEQPTMPAASAASRWEVTDAADEVRIGRATAAPTVHGLVFDAGGIAILDRGEGLRATLSARLWREVARRAEAIADEMEGKGTSPAGQARGEGFGNLDHVGPAANA